MLYRIKRLIVKVMPPDKNYHFTVGLVLGLYTKQISAIWLNIWYARLIAMGLVTLVALYTEYRDKKSGKGTPERADILYTILGGIVGMI